MAAFSYCETETHEIFYVQARNGLRMREEPSQTSRYLLTIPNLSPVTVIDRTGETIELEKRIGQWTEVLYQGKTGWVFGGHLSRTDANKLEATIQTVGETRITTIMFEAYYAGLLESIHPTTDSTIDPDYSLFCIDKESDLLPPTAYKNFVLKIVLLENMRNEGLRLPDVTNSIERGSPRFR